MRHFANVESDDAIKLRALIGHREFVRAGDSLEFVQQRFAAGRQDFMAVLEGRTLLGLCSRREIGTRLGARYGFALFARVQVAEHLSPDPVIFRTDTPIPEALRQIALRRDEHFYDDVLLVDARGEFLGLIHVRDLVRLQQQLLATHLDELATRNRQMEEDLRMAREVQVALLPRDFPECRGESGRSLGLAQCFTPAGGLSGDFFDVIPLSPTSVGLLMCDVMGHGVRSALVTAMVRTMVEEARGLAAAPGQFLARLNMQLAHLLQRTGDVIFVTACYVVLDVEAQCLELSHAGHPFPVLWRARERRCAALAEAAAVGGPALGLIEQADYATAQVQWGIGDRLLLYTDGVTEAATPADEEFGVAALCAAWARGASLPLAQAAAQLQASAAAHTAGRGFSDDVCLLAAELRA